MIIVTGGAGFIGSNLVHQLNRIGETDILVVDNLAPAPNLSGPKFLNLWGADYTDYMDKAEFRRAFAAGDFEDVPVRAILHQGACSNTLEDDGRYMMDNNYTYSKELLDFAVWNEVPFVYASTAAVYGLSENFAPVKENEKPLNVYGYSKLVFDNYVRRNVIDPAAEEPDEGVEEPGLLQKVKSTVVGFCAISTSMGRGSSTKGRMASVIHHFTKQLRETGTIKMFQGSGGYADGEQRRDFVFVQDLCRINLFFAGTVTGEPEAAGAGGR